jgi:hypothetical protein
MPVPGQVHYGFPSFPVVDWFCHRSTMKIHRLLSSLQNGFTKQSSSYTIWFQMRCWMTSCLNHDYLILIFIYFPYLLIRAFPNMCNNISASPAYGVYISQLIRYARISSNYSDFLKRHLYLRNRLLDQGYKKIRFIRSLIKFIFINCEM